MPSTLASFRVGSKDPTQVFALVWQEIDWLTGLLSLSVTVSHEVSKVPLLRNYTSVVSFSHPAAIGLRKQDAQQIH